MLYIINIYHYPDHNTDQPHHGLLWDHFTIPAHFGTILLSWLTLGPFYYPGSLWDHFTIPAHFGTI